MVGHSAVFPLFLLFPTLPQQHFVSGGVREYYLVFGLGFLGLLVSWKLNSSGFELLLFPEAAKWCALQRYLLERKFMKDKKTVFSEAQRESQSENRKR